MKWERFDIRDLSQDEYHRWYSVMDREKQHRVDRFRLIDDRKRTVAGDMLARLSIAEWCDIPAESICFQMNKFGKPFAKGLPVEFNISHSGNVVVCAVDSVPVGIDVEHIRPIDMKVVNYICCSDELKYIFGQKTYDKDFTIAHNPEFLARFFEIWTAKEAYCKCLGTGITDLKLINTQSDTMQIRRLVFGDYCVSFCVKNSCEL